MTTGFTGGGLEGIGYGMALDASDYVWAGTYGTQTIVKFDKTGKPLSPPGWLELQQATWADAGSYSHSER